MFRFCAIALFSALIGVNSSFGADWKLGVKLVAADGGGVEIVEVFKDSPADQIGLKPGNVLLLVDNVVVNNPILVRALVVSDKQSTKMVYFDGVDCYEVVADYVVVTAIQQGKKVEVLQQKNITKKKVPDPRKTK